MIRPFDPEALPAAPVQLVEASAGTGKTYSITSLYLRFILEQELEVERILVLSFTEAATAELHSRLRARLQAAYLAYQRGGDEEDPFLESLVRKSLQPQRDLLLLQRAISGMDQAAVTTIHSFCQRVLQHGAFESGMPFELELVSELEPFIDELIYDFGAILSHGDDPRLLEIWRREYTFKDLHFLAMEALRHRYFPLLSARGEITFARREEGKSGESGAVPLKDGLAEQLAGLQQSHGKLRQCWLSHGDDVAQELRTAGFLKEYKKMIEAGLVEQLAAYLASDQPQTLLLPPGFSSLTPSAFNDPEAKVCGRPAIKNGRIPKHHFFQLWESYLEQLEAISRRYCAVATAEFVAFAREELPQRLYSSGICSFDDLLYSLEQALKNSESLRRLVAARYPVAMIDEFQDTDPIQYAIFRHIYGRGRKRGSDHDLPPRLILIGDPKQAIYAFRGADIFAYLQAARESGDQRYTISVNWRADRGMLEAVNALFRGAQNPFVVPGIDFPQVAPRPMATDLWRERGEGGASDRVPTSPLQFLLPDEHLRARICGNSRTLPARTMVERLVPSLVARDILSLLSGRAGIGEKSVRPADIAVLVRSNRQASKIQGALQKLGIAAVLQSRDTVFAGSEARQLSILLHGLVDEAGEAQRRAAMLTTILDCTPSELMVLQDDEKVWHGWLLRFKRWNELWRTRGVMAMLRAISEERKVASRLLTRADGQRQLTNLRHLMELLHQREREGHLQPSDLVRWLDGGVAGRRSGAEADELRLESDEEAVQVLTIHRSKGLEFPVVYCPYLWVTGKKKSEQSDKFFTFHDPEESRQGKITIDPDDNQRRIRRRELFAEDVRLLYVALTRARHCCRLLWFAATGYEESALAYLLHGNGEGSPPPALHGLSFSELEELLVRRIEQVSEWGVRRVDGGLPEGEKPDLSRAGKLTGGEERAIREMSRAIDITWRTGSFSQLVAGGGELHPLVGGRDYDAFTDPDSALRQGRKSSTLFSSPIALAELPSGAGIGNLWHRLLEFVSFNTPQAHPEIIAEQLRLFGLERKRWQHPMEGALEAIISTPFAVASPNNCKATGCGEYGKYEKNGADGKYDEGGTGGTDGAGSAERQTIRLMDIDDGARLNEMAFTFPVSQGGRAPLEAADLAAIFRDYPGNLPTGYQESLQRLRFSALKGYLKGFVDLIILHRNRWYLVDYKSNFLGRTYADYQPGELLSVMGEHHYILQYHLYTLALHRHLQLRLPGYDYDRHFGGVYYLFLRGMHPELGPKAGIHHDLPPRERVEALSKLFGN